MLALRRWVPAIAAALALIVAVQTTDLIACADEATVAPPVHASGGDALGVDALGSEASGASGCADACDLAEAPPSAPHGHHEGAIDCLCHVAFAPTATSPTVGARPEPEALPPAASAVAPPEADLDGQEPVPLA